MIGLELYIELCRFTNQFAEFIQLMHQYITIIGKVHGLKSAQAMNAYLKQATMYTTM